MWLNRIKCCLKGSFLILLSYGFNSKPKNYFDFPMLYFIRGKWFYKDSKRYWISSYWGFMECYFISDRLPTNYWTNFDVKTFVNVYGHIIICVLLDLMYFDYSSDFWFLFMYIILRIIILEYCKCWILCSIVLRIVIWNIVILF